MKKILATLILLTSISASASGGKSFNIFVNPITLGILSGGLDFKVGNSSILGPTFANWNLSVGTTSLSTQSFGLRYGYYFSGAIQSSWRFLLGAEYIPIRLTSGTYSGTSSMIGGSAIFGYHWVPGTFNMSFGAGVAFAGGNSTYTLTNSGGGTQTVNAPFTVGAGLGLELSIGLAF